MFSLHGPTWKFPKGCAVNQAWEEARGEVGVGGTLVTLDPGNSGGGAG